MSLATPVPTPETLPFWEGALKRELHLQFCASCARWVFHPRRRCPHCEADALEWRQASGRGRLWSYNIVHRAEQGFDDRAPYVVAIVALEEGPHLLGNVIGVTPDPAHLQIDMPLTVDFEDRGDQRIPVWRVEVPA